LSSLDGSSFRDKLLDVVEVILSANDRLKTVEKKNNDSSIPERKADMDQESERKAQVDGERPLEFQSCVPQIRMFDWYNFKHKWVGDKRYAIEVLKGPAKYYQDQTKEQRQYDRSKKAGKTPVRSPSDPEQDTLLPQEIPERIRIMSSPLIAIITELDSLGFGLDLTPGIMLRPYRRLARIEDDLMKHLAGLEAKWGVAEKEDLEK
jgi:hypothetical protein